MIDSGASCNVDDKETSQDLKMYVQNKGTHNVYPYGAAEPLNIRGKFMIKSLVKLNEKDTEAEFIVISGKGMSRLGRKTALELGVLKIGLRQINSIDLSLKVRFQECFNGIGKLKDYQAKINAC